MLDINFIESNLVKVKEQLNKRSGEYTLILDEAVELNIQRKSILKEVENLKANKNNLSKQVGELMRNKQVEEANKIKNDVASINTKIDTLDEKLKEVQEELTIKLQNIPNIPNDDMPVGNDDNDNVEVRVWGNEFVKNHDTAHWDIADKLKLVDFEAGPKLSGSRFVVYTGLGSKLVRSLANVILDLHTSKGYKEITVPLLVNPQAMYGTGQLPKFKEDAYITANDQYLIPTGEVPLTNLHAGEILDANQLPIHYTTYSQCFRQEAGSAGRDTKGLIRLHQFNKVELVKLTDQESSEIELQTMVKDAEAVLQLFNLPYRVVELCTGDVGFSSTKTYDLEVWFPEQNKYREISSCSNCTDFQARNMQTRYRDANGEVKLVHTLNGSGVAIDRLIAAILENYWDGEKLIIPTVLKPYFGNQEFIK
ncbi:seryl-tRNA synthetase [Mesoplasma entomophilum]|uniref:Serine--tRNA ligase n=1 Tax=Mesoplasma entomophilum TaxID=2149 RepID=A0A3S5XYP4_9MOLU|nr:serine--tRNA ligase [Mesoplasma entomophilum]ATQ35182.1 serine--tRNA ligase [Mesoplasma entomophilum]ATZ19128.1 seryl-tRNA synthetase [Mesoplasma entomophilum]